MDISLDRILSKISRNFEKNLVKILWKIKENFRTIFGQVVEKI